MKKPGEYFKTRSPGLVLVEIYANPHELGFGEKSHKERTRMEETEVAAGEEELGERARAVSLFASRS